MLATQIVFLQFYSLQPTLLLENQVAVILRGQICKTEQYLWSQQQIQ